MKLHLDDCINALKQYEDNSIDACVTDPPYGLSFMGKGWDYDVPSSDIWKEVYRVLKPGGHLLTFFGSRTYHRGAVQIEDAGFEIRDQIMWVYGSGFPKSHDVSKAIDKHYDIKRDVIGTRSGALNNSENSTASSFVKGSCRFKPKFEITTPSSLEAQNWNGWGTALKPAHEPIVVARKPLNGTVAENVLNYGCGALNIDGCRVGDEVETWPKTRSYAPGQKQPNHIGNTQNTGVSPPGRWPANIIHDGSDEVVELFPSPHGAGHSNYKKTREAYDASNYEISGGELFRYGDSGSAARFFYCAKASKADRDLENIHPTVKPTQLMRYLCKLVTPPNGTVLDPFMGSGSTGKAAKLEGFNFIGVEREKEYFEIAKRRIENIKIEETQNQNDFFFESAQA